jgi:hypothetical protein
MKLKARFRTDISSYGTAIDPGPVEFYICGGALCFSTFAVIDRGSVGIDVNGAISFDGRVISSEVGRATRITNMHVTNASRDYSSGEAVLSGEVPFELEDQYLRALSPDRPADFNRAGMLYDLMLNIPPKIGGGLERKVLSITHLHRIAGRMLLARSSGEFGPPLCLRAVGKFLLGQYYLYRARYLAKKFIVDEGFDKTPVKYFGEIQDVLWDPSYVSLEAMVLAEHLLRSDTSDYVLATSRLIVALSKRETRQDGYGDKAFLHNVMEAVSIASSKPDVIGRDEIIGRCTDVLERAGFEDEAIALRKMHEDRGRRLSGVFG